MDKMGIKTSILSITSPGTYLAPPSYENATEIARKITRETNDELAAVCKQYPSRFKFFASLPLPDVEGAIAEIDRALDNLGATGFVIMSNSAGVYAGEKALGEVWTKLNDRKATVLMHPTSCHLVAGGSGTTASACACSAAGEITRNPTKPAMSDHTPLTGYPNPMLEFLFDTTRSVVSLILSGTIQRCPDVKLIIPHAGAVIPPLVARFAAFSSYMATAAAKALNSMTGDEAMVVVSMAEVKSILASQCYFDLAGVPFPDQIKMLLAVMPDPGRLLYGTDFPYTPGDSLVATRETFEGAVAAFFGDKAEGIMSTNAETFFHQGR